MVTLLNLCLISEWNVKVLMMHVEDSLAKGSVLEHFKEDDDDLQRSAGNLSHAVITFLMMPH